jgi:hypothetical protein
MLKNSRAIPDSLFALFNQWDRLVYVFGAAPADVAKNGRLMTFPMHDEFPRLSVACRLSNLYV